MKLVSLVFLVIAQIMAAGTCTASPLTIACRAEGDTVLTFDITLDIDRRTMTWGGSQFEIREVTERYITAFEPPSQTWERVGGEVWVLDRVTGEYLRATVRFTSRGVNGSYTPRALTADTYRGKCTRPLI